MISIQDFMNAELRIAEIEDVQEHPNADRLYVLKIKVGQEQKQIVAGIRKHYGRDELKGKKIVIVNNLEPAVIRGVESNGMLLAASHEDQFSLVVPERQMTHGAKIK
ncbi:MAG: methionine--tRNA ligase subunit beta [Candidatus Omnitrophica bacterium]|nr:methionine--tRNA ligase subunit beta [Candidatus Omnitrophota bacterium]